MKKSTMVGLKYIHVHIEKIWKVDVEFFYQIVLHKYRLEKEEIISSVTKCRQTVYFLLENNY